MKNERIKQHDINQIAWSVCDTFRCAMNTDDYKEYILVMLFLKYVSDVWNDWYSTYQHQYGDDNIPWIQQKLERDCFTLPKGCRFYDIYDRRDDPNIGVIINDALAAIEWSNNEKLAGVFRNIDFNSDRNFGKKEDRHRRLKILLEDFNKPQLDLRPSRISGDVIGNTYMYLIDRFSCNAGKKSGEFYTPHKVSELIANLSRPKAGARICDPSCGSGGLLIEAAKVVGSQDYSLYGMEVNGNTWALCRMNMFLHGVNSARIDWCNTLTDPTLVEEGRLMTFDNIVANPPFSLDKWGADNAGSDAFNRFWRGLPPKSKGDYAFISHMVESVVEKKGRIVVVVPHGVLFRRAAEGRIRTSLIQENLLDAVIGLPSNLFSTTTTSVAILILDRSREKGAVNENQTDVLFIDASHGYESGKNQNILLDSHMNMILKTYENRQCVPKYAHLASFDELKSNDFDLSITNYVTRAQKAPPTNIGLFQTNIHRIERELVDIRARKDMALKELVE